MYESRFRVGPVETHGLFQQRKSFLRIPILNVTMAEFEESRRFRPFLDNPAQKLDRFPKRSFFSQNRRQMKCSLCPQVPMGGRIQNAGQFERSFKQGLGPVEFSVQFEPCRQT